MNSKRLISVTAALAALLFNARADITSGLVLQLHLDETTGLTASDSSGNANNGTLQNFTGDNSYWTNGWINGGLIIGTNGVTNYVSIPDAASLNFTNERTFSLAAWVKMPTAQLGGSALIAKGTGNGGEQYDLDINASKFRLVVRPASGGAAVTVSSAANIVNNQWQHIVAVCDGTNAVSKTVRIYVNGQLSANVTNNTVLAALRYSVSPLTIGARQSGSAAYNLGVTNTLIDEVRIYNRNLPASDVYELYSLNGRLPALTVQPRNITNYVGDYAPFSVAIDNNNSTLPVAYQWKWYGTNLPNATNATLVISNVTLFNSGPYSASISNVIGITNSSVAYLQVQTLPAPDISANLAGYWKFDDASGSSTAFDSSANANPGTLVGFFDFTSCWVTGLTNGALNFNGDASTANLVAIPNSGTPGPSVLDFNAGQAFTLAAWVKASLPQTNGAAIICKGSGGGGEQYAMDINGSNFRFYVRDTNGAAVNLNTTVPLNGTWQHVAAVLDVTNGIMNYYVNGQLVNVAIPPGSVNTNNHEVSIGNRQSGALTPYDRPFSGAIDDARIYGRALNSADIQALYATGGLYPPSFVNQPQGGSIYVGEDFNFSVAVGGTFPISFQWRTNGVNIPGATNSTLILTNVQLAQAGTYTLFASNAYGTLLSSGAVLQVTNFFLTNLLAGWWKLDDATGLTAADSSANANPGNLVNFPNDDSEWVRGRINGALNVNPPGVTNYVFVSDAPALNFDSSLAFTLSAWVRGSAAAQFQSGAVLCKGTGGGGEHYCIDIQGGTFRFFCRTATGTAPGIVTTNPPTGFWQNLAVAFDGNAGFMRFYVNGQLVGTNAAPNSLNTTAHELSIGCRQSAAGLYNLPFLGDIDDVRIYSRALSTYDVQALYAEAAPQAPYFYAQPQGGSRYVGESFVFTANAEGAQPLAFQWQKDSVDIPGATNLSLVLTNLQLSDSGSYTLLVTNSLGSTNSAAAALAVSTFNIANTAAYYQLDETTGQTAADSSGNGNTGSLFNMPLDDSEWIPGRINRALNFNADSSGDDYVSVAESPSINFTANPVFSIAAWVRGSSAQLNGAGIIAKGAGAGGEQFAIDAHIDQLPTVAYRFYARNSAGTVVNCTTPVALNGRWQHVVAVFDGIAGVMQCYVNGQLVSSVPGLTSLLSSTHELSIGNRQSGAGPYNLPFTGAVDDVRLYHHALTSNEVQQIYALAPTFTPVIYAQPQDTTKYVHDSVMLSASSDGSDPLTYQWKKDGFNIPGATNTSLAFPDLKLSDAGLYALAVTNSYGFTLSARASLTVLSLPAPDITNELIAYWAFDETNGISASDSSGRGNNASLYEFPFDDSQWAPGIVGGALHFSTNSGAGNYRVATDLPIAFDNGNQFTFSLWAKRDPGPAGTNPRFLSTVGGQSWFGWTPGRGVGFLTPAVSTEPVTGVWHHFVVIYDRLAGSYSLYVDGVRQVTNATGYARNDPAAAPQFWFIGHSETTTSTTDSFTGLLDEVRIYNRFLNYNDIQALYLSGGQPRLGISVSGTSITLFWSVVAAGFNLYSADSVTGGSWSAVGVTPTTSADGATQSVTLSLSDVRKFYRLQKP